MAVDRRVVVKGAFWAAAASFVAAARAPAAGQGAVSATPGWMRDAKLPPGVRLLPRIKLMVLIARRPDISSDRFHDYWLTHHAALALSVADEVKLQRYVQSHEVPSSIAPSFAGARGWTANIFEGITEGWWDSEQEMVAAFTTPAGMAVNQRLIEDERRFCDNRTVAIITREYAIFERGGAGA